MLFFVPFQSDVVKTFYKVEIPFFVDSFLKRFIRDWDEIDKSLGSFIKVERNSLQLKTISRSKEEEKENDNTSSSTECLEKCKTIL